MEEKNIMKYIVGIDEVGRGPIAGPVAVGVFCINKKEINILIKKAKEELSLPIRDSKKLTKKQREKWFKFLHKYKKEEKCDFVVSFVSSEMIDKFGINKCIQKALDKSIEKLNLKKEEIFIYLDGGLKAPDEYLNQESLIKGDESVSVISLASIVAKVKRDRVMINYAKVYPKYGFDNHVGYGTKAHYEVIEKYGILPIHRVSYLSRILEK